MPEINEHVVNVLGRIDTWYVVFSPHVDPGLFNRWLRATTDEEMRHVYLVQRAGRLGINQIETSAFGAFCENHPITIPEFLLHAKRTGRRVVEWGIQWDRANMGRRLQSETLTLRDRTTTRRLADLRAPVYIQPGYFSCVALVKVFLNIIEPTIQTPRELFGYLLAQGALEV